MCLAVIALVSYMALGLRAGGNLAAACWATRPWEGEVKAVENQWREVESTTESPAQLQSDGSDMEPIHTAATYGNADALGRELAKNVSPDLVCANGFVPLDYVVSGAIGRGSNNRVACIHLLAAAGANVNTVVDGYGAGEMISMTPLMYAVAGGHSTLVAALLDAGSDVNSRDRIEWTPLHFAIYSDDTNNEECARLLINAGAAVDARDNEGRTPLDLAVQLNNRRCLYSILLRAGAALPAVTGDAYLLKVRAAGGFRAYKRAHLNALAATFLPKLPSLPPELVRRVVEYAFHVGDY